jgi:hypothetical protein
LADQRRIFGAATVGLLAASLPACLSPVPLDPTPQADLDPRIVGGWRCLSAEMDDDDKPLSLTVARRRERVYAVEMSEPGDDPERFEAHASLVEGRIIVNVRDITRTAGSKPWDFAEYTFLRPDVLEIRLAGFEDDDVELTPAALRSRIAQPGAFSDFCVCLRQRKKE